MRTKKLNIAINNMIDEYKELSLLEVEDADINNSELASYFAMSGMKLISNQIENLCSSIGLKPLGFFIDTSAVAESTRLSEKLIDFIFFKGNCFDKDKFLEAYSKIYSAFAEHGRTIYYHKDFFRCPERMECIISSVGREDVKEPLPISQIKKILASYEKGGELKINIEKPKVEELNDINSDPSFFGMIPLNTPDLTNWKSNDKNSSFLVENHNCLHLAFHQKLFTKIENYTSIFISIPIVGAAKNVGDKSLSGQGAIFILLVFDSSCKLDIFKEFVMKLSYVCKDIFLSYLYDSATQLVKETRKHALMSAIAAIMTRNMSHNIGSHVIFYGVQQPTDYDANEYKRFLLYLQERMDYLSIVATSEASWATDYKLIKILKSFKEQSLLLNNIIKSETPLAIEIKFDKSTNTDVLMPHGEVGKHALFTILENYIRNSAKHQFSDLSDEEQKKQTTIEIIVRCEDDRAYPDHYQIFISNNIHYCKENLVEDLNKKILDCLIDESGMVISSNRGLKEQRISACFLRLMSFESLDKKDNDFIKAICINPTTLETKETAQCTKKRECSVGLKILLRKPMELLWIEDHSLDSAKISELKKRGIYWYRNLVDALDDFPETFPMKMALVSEAVFNGSLEWFENQKNIRKLPYRFLVLGRIDVNERNIISVSEDTVPKLTHNLDSFKKDLLFQLWKRWVEIFYPNQPDIKVLYNDLKTHPIEFPIQILNSESQKMLDDETRYIIDHDTGTKRERNFFYIPTSSGEGNSIVAMIKTAASNKHVAWQIAEMAYTRILIIDERMYDSRDKIKKVHGKHEKIKQVWERQGVNLVDHVKFIKDPASILNVLKIHSRYNFFIIHQGVIDKVKKNIGDDEFRKLLVKIKLEVDFLVVDSGRGLPDTVRDGDGRWLHLPDLEHNMLEKANTSGSKFTLVQILYSLREKGG